MTFLAFSCEILIVRETIYNYNKEDQIFLLEREQLSFKCMLCGWIDRTISVLVNYANLWNCSKSKLFLGCEWFHFLVLNLLQQMSNEGFKKQWSISMLIILLCFMHSELYHLSVKFSVPKIQYITHTNNHLAP